MGRGLPNMDWPITFRARRNTGRSAARLARLLREQEVRGSNPRAPIRNAQRRIPWRTRDAALCVAGVPGRRLPLGTTAAAVPLAAPPPPLPAVPRAAPTLASRAYVEALQMVADGDRGRVPICPPPPRKIDLYWGGSQSQPTCGPDVPMWRRRRIRPGDEERLFLVSRRAVPSRPIRPHADPRVLPQLAGIRVCRLQALAWCVVDEWLPAGRSREWGHATGGRFNDTFRAPSGSAGAV